MCISLYTLLKALLKTPPGEAWSDNKHVVVFLSPKSVFCTDLHFLALLELRSLSCLWSTGCGEAGFPGSNEVPSVWGKPIAFHRSAYSVIQAPATQRVLLFVESCGSWAAPGWERGRVGGLGLCTLGCDKWAELDFSQVTCAGEL